MTKLELFDWQRKDRDALVEAGGVGLINACPGAGKTVLAVETAVSLEAKQVLVIAPLVTHPKAWAQTVEGQTSQVIRKIGNGGRAEKAALFDLEMGEPGWYITTPQFMTRSDVSSWRPDVLIADEVHQYTTPMTKGQKNLLNLRSEHRLALSGTPARNKFSNLWGVCRFLWPERSMPSDIADTNFARWQRERMVSRKVYTSQRDAYGNPKTVDVFDTEKEPGLLLSRMPLQLSHFATERCCDAHPNGVLADLKEPSVMEEVVPMTPVQKRVIKDMQTTLVTFLEDNPMVAEIPLTAQQRIRQAILGVPNVEWTINDRGEDVQTVSFSPDCDSPFLDETMKILDDLGDEPAVVWTDSEKFTRVAAHRLQQAGIRTGVYSGSRKDDPEGLGSEYRVLVAMISAAGTGLDGLQGLCFNEIWLSRDLDQTNNEQAEYRLWRRGQKNSVRRWYLHDDLGISEGRFSDQVAKRLELNRSLKVA